MQILRVNSKKLDVVAEWDLSEDQGARLGIKYPCWARSGHCGESYPGARHRSNSVPGVRSRKKATVTNCLK